jgi:alcohol dehydrogenase class IV
MRSFSYQALPGRIVFGAGSAHARLAAELDRLGSKRLLLIVSQRAEPLARELAAAASAEVAAVCTDVRQHVPVEVADAARKLARRARVDAVLSVGGGSATGTAKAVALTSGLPIVAVPTTYAGSEVTPVWGLTDGAVAGKRTGVDAGVLPAAVVYDPELTGAMPQELAAASGFNALAHGVEAFWASGRNPVSSLLAEEGIRALVAGLETLAADPADRRGHNDALYGAYLAASAFATTGSGLHHKICHVLGGAYGLPHAQTHAVVLPAVVSFQVPGAGAALARIAAALGVDDAGGGLRDLAARLGLPRGLRDLGLAREQLPDAVRLIRPVVPADNPRPVTQGDLERLLEAAWAGTTTGAGP